MLAIILLTPALLTSIVDVSIVGKRFVPDSVRIEPGDTVRWTQMDPTLHTSTGNGDAEWYSGPISQNNSYQRVFITAGTFVYRCSYHASMTGRVVVGAAGPTAIFMSPQ